MEAEQVVEKILADARSEADKIKKEADAKQAEELAQLDKQLRDYEKQTGALAEKAASDTKLHLLAKTRMDITKQYLAEKRKILDNVFDKALKELKALPGEQFGDDSGRHQSTGDCLGDDAVKLAKNRGRGNVDGRTERRALAILDIL